MSEVRSSSLLREMRKEDPRRWLTWSLEELVERLQWQDDAEGLRDECAQMLETIAAWPENLLDVEDASRMMKRVDAIRAELGERTADEKERTADEKKRTADEKKGDGSSDEPPPGASDTGYKVTLDREAGKRRRTNRPTPPNRELQKPRPIDHVSSNPPRKNSKPRAMKTDETRSDPPNDEPRRKGADGESPTALAVRPAATPQVASTVVVTKPSSRPPPESKTHISVEIIDIDPEIIPPELALIASPRGQVAEAYRALHYRIGASSDARIIMVTTSADDEACAESAANLALAIAEESERVLLVEAHFARPRIATLLGYLPSECFARRLARHRKTPEAPWRVAQLADTNLGVLAVNPTQATAPALDAQTLGAVLESFRDDGYEHIIVSGPPVTEHSDARFVARSVEGVVMCIHQGKSRQRVVRRAVDLLGVTPLLGYVLVES
jgi:Mrp family chromosome partitioning ATPase